MSQNIAPKAINKTKFEADKIKCDKCAPIDHCTTLLMRKRQHITFNA